MIAVVFGIFILCQILSFLEVAAQSCLANIGYFFALRRRHASPIARSYISHIQAIAGRVQSLLFLFRLFLFIVYSNFAHDFVFVIAFLVALVFFFIQEAAGVQLDQIGHVLELELGRAQGSQLSRVLFHVSILIRHSNDLVQVFNIAALVAIALLGICCGIHL